MEEILPIRGGALAWICAVLVQMLAVSLGTRRPPPAVWTFSLYDVCWSVFCEFYKFFLWVVHLEKYSEDFSDTTTIEDAAIAEPWVKQSIDDLNNTEHTFDDDEDEDMTAQSLAEMKDKEDHCVVEREILRAVKKEVEECDETEDTTTPAMDDDNEEREADYIAAKVNTNLYFKASSGHDLVNSNKFESKYNRPKNRAEPGLRTGHDIESSCGSDNGGGGADESGDDENGDDGSGGDGNCDDGGGHNGVADGGGDNGGGDDSEGDNCSGDNTAGDFGGGGNGGGDNGSGDNGGGDSGGGDNGGGDKRASDDSGGHNQGGDNGGGEDGGKDKRSTEDNGDGGDNVSGDGSSGGWGGQWLWLQLVFGWLWWLGFQWKWFDNNSNGDSVKSDNDNHSNGTESSGNIHQATSSSPSTTNPSRSTLTRDIPTSKPTRKKHSVQPQQSPGTKVFVRKKSNPDSTSGTFDYSPDTTVKISGDLERQPRYRKKKKWKRRSHSWRFHNYSHPPVYDNHESQYTLEGSCEKPLDENLAVLNTVPLISTTVSPETELVTPPFEYHSLKPDERRVIGSLPNCVIGCENLKLRSESHNLTVVCTPPVCQNQFLDLPVQCSQINDEEHPLQLYSCYVTDPLYMRHLQGFRQHGARSSVHRVPDPVQVPQVSLPNPASIPQQSSAKQDENNSTFVFSVPSRSRELAPGNPQGAPGSSRVHFLCLQTQADL